LSVFLWLSVVLKAHFYDKHQALPLHIQYIVLLLGGNKTQGGYMKKILLAFALTIMATTTYANEVKFINGDGSAHTQLCIAAIKSDHALTAKANEHGYSNAKVSKLNCNGMPIDKFAQMYRNQMHEAGVKAIKVFSFNKGVQNLEADVCIAAASSNDKFKAIRAGLTKPISYYRAITCNGMSLTAFAKKYGNKNFTL
jgi:hypothetical protein